MISHDDEATFYRHRDTEHELATFLRRPTRDDINPVRVVDPHKGQLVFTLTWHELAGVLAIVASAFWCVGYYISRGGTF